jgi:hypothetical protein
MVPVYREYVPGSVEVAVISIESANAIRVIVGVGVGHLDGGSHRTWSASEVPIDLRRPNARFWFVPPS